MHKSGCTSGMCSTGTQRAGRDGGYTKGDRVAKDFAKAFYKSKAWKGCREAYISKRIVVDGGMCEVCHQRMGYIVHHIVPLTPDNIGDPLVTLNHDNLRYDCKECHDREDDHFIPKGKKLLCAFDESGQPLPP